MTVSSKKAFKEIQIQHDIVSVIEYESFALAGIAAPEVPHFTLDSKVTCISTEFGRSIPLPKATPIGVQAVVNSKELEIIIDTPLVPNYCLVTQIWENPVFAGVPILRKTVVSFQPQTEIKHTAINDIVWILVNNINIPANNLVGCRLHLLARLSG